jgi:hypothetical protein
VLDGALHNPGYATSDVVPEGLWRPLLNLGTESMIRKRLDEEVSQ